MLGLLLAIAFVLPADAPKAAVTVKESYRPGSLVIIDGSKSSGDSFKWVSFEGDDFLPVNGDKQVVFASGTPGRYKFLLIATGVVDGKGVSDTTEVVVTIAGFIPPPVPPPNPLPVPPKPDPDPKPPEPTPPKPVVVPGRIFGFYLMDHADMKPAYVAMRRNKVIEKELDGLNASFRVYESNEMELDPTRDPFGMLEEAKKVGLPCYFAIAVRDPAVSPDAEILKIVPNPTPAKVVEVMRELRGK